MVDLDLTAIALLATSPAVVSIVSTVIGLVRSKLHSKKVLDETLKEVKLENQKVQKSYDDIAIIKSKVESIEKHLIEKEGNK